MKQIFLEEVLNLLNHSEIKSIIKIISSQTARPAILQKLVSNSFRFNLKFPGVPLKIAGR